MITASNLSNSFKARLRPFLMPPLQKKTAMRFRSPMPGGLEAVETALRTKYFSSKSNFLDTPRGKGLLNDQIQGRLETIRRTVIPWLLASSSLEGLSILEIGCGTGCSTVALAEQGARVTAVDIDPGSLAVAKERCRVYGVEACFEQVNATEVNTHLEGNVFDIILFFAVLEHMTYAERLEAMNKTWNMLPSGALWGLIDTPNRLWFFDGHTSELPFFHWLPDDLAVLFSKFSPRTVFNHPVERVTDQNRERLIREGRGVSFHEFSLAMAPAETLDVISCLPIFLRKSNLLRMLAWQLSTERAYANLLKKIDPRISSGFYQPPLELLIRKP